MPVLRFKRERLERLTGLPLERLEEVLFRLKCEVEVSDDGETVEVEVNPDRPDMYLGEGVARAVKGLIGSESGWEGVRVVDSEVKLRVERVPQRPYIAAAVVYNVDVDEEFLEELIQFQEKLHETLGRRRVKAAIGFHDLDKLPSKTITYRLSPLTTRLKPLDYEVEMSFEEFLRADERGTKYGGLALDEERLSHPFLYSGDKVIAAPPVINSQITRVEDGTKHLIIDVTGVSERVVTQVLDVIVSTLTERRDAYVGRVSVEGEAPWSSTPLLEEKSLKFSLEEASRWLGVEFNEEDAVRLLGSMRLKARALGGGLIEVVIPPYRVDVLGKVDVFEDLAIAVGYEELGPRWPGKMHGGSLQWETYTVRALKELLVGLGFTEVMQLTLTSPELVEASGFKEIAVEVLNPVQREYSVLRPSLLISLLQALAANQYKKKPVKLFEVGSIVYLEGGEPRDEVRLALAVLDDEASFEDVQAPLYGVLEVLGVEFKPRGASHPMLMDGRTALLEVEGETLAWLGEVKPEILEAFGLEHPVAAAEVSIEVLSRWRSRI